MTRYRATAEGQIPFTAEEEAAWDAKEAAILAAKPAKDRADAWEAIKLIRDTKKLEGGYTTGGKWYHSDTFSRTQQLGLVMMGANVPAVQWKTMDGSFVAMTQTLAGQIFASAAAQDSAMFTHAETLKAQVDASNDPASIDITVGWPAVYVPA